MTREELERVVNRIYYIETVDRFFDLEEADVNLRELKAALRVFKAAVRKQLALMPEKCEICGGDGFFTEGHAYSSQCPTCRGSGKVYPAELVERIATALLARWESAATYGGVADYREDAVAVLDALGDFP